MPNLSFRHLICSDALNALEIIENQNAAGIRGFPFDLFSELFPSDDRYSEGEFCGLVDMSLQLCDSKNEKTSLLLRFLKHIADLSLHALPSERIYVYDMYCSDRYKALIR